MAAFEELDFDYNIIGITQEYGLDAYSTPQVMAFAVELYEAGILTDTGPSGISVGRCGEIFLSGGKNCSPGRDW